MSPAPARWRMLAPDMRGFGRSEPAPLDATRGLGDWADDLVTFLDALGVTAPAHLVGRSTAGAAIALVARRRPVASLTFLDPVPPYGFGGTSGDGRPCTSDHAGTGGGVAHAAFVERLRTGDRSGDDGYPGDATTSPHRPGTAPGTRGILNALGQAGVVPGWPGADAWSRTFLGFLESVA